MKPEFDYAAVLAAISGWPAEHRASLAHALIDSLKTDGSVPRHTKPSLDELVGVARGDSPAPTDEQVKQWVDEDRMKKYGR